MRRFPWFWLLAIGLFHFIVTLVVLDCFLTVDATTRDGEPNFYLRILFIWAPLLAYDANFEHFLRNTAIGSIGIAALGGLLIAILRKRRATEQAPPERSQIGENSSANGHPRRRIKPILHTGVLLVELTVAIWLAPGRTRDHRRFSLLDWFRFHPMAGTVEQASSFALHEGIPREGFDVDALLHALNSQQRVPIGTRTFRQPPFSVSTEDREALRRLTSTLDSYWPLGGPKACLGFHPDYLLTWEDGNKRCDLLPCFSCGEMLCYDGRSWMVFNLRDETYNGLLTILGKYGTNALEHHPLTPDPRSDSESVGRSVPE